MNLILDNYKRKIVRAGLKFWIDGKDFTNLPPSPYWKNRVNENFNFIPHNLLYTNLSGSSSDGLGVVIFRNGVPDYFDATNIINVSNGFTMIIKFSNMQEIQSDSTPAVSVFTANRIGVYTRTDSFKAPYGIIYNSNQSNYSTFSYPNKVDTPVYITLAVDSTNIYIYVSGKYLAKIPQSPLNSISNFSTGIQGNGKMSFKLYYAMLYDRILSPYEINYMYSNNL